MCSLKIGQQQHRACLVPDTEERKEDSGKKVEPSSTSFTSQELEDIREDFNQRFNEANQVFNELEKSKSDEKSVLDKQAEQVKRMIDLSEELRKKFGIDPYGSPHGEGFYP